MSSTLFAGSSRFATDLGSVIDRSVAIASLPLKQYQQQLQTLEDRSTALQKLGAKVGNLQSAVENLGTLFESSTLTASSTNSNAVRPSVRAGAVQGEYSVSVSDLGSATTFVVSGFPPTADVSAPAYTSGGILTLLIDANPLDGQPGTDLYTLTPGASSLKALVEEINTKAGSVVRATAVNVGTSSTPNYQLSLQSTKLGSFDIKVTNGAISSVNTADQRGTAVVYRINGAEVESDSRNVTLAPGLTVELLQDTTTPATVSVEASAGTSRTALQTFVSAYNAVAAEVAGHRQNAGSVLKGDSVLGTVDETLRRLIETRFGSGDFQTLADLGIGINSDYDLELDGTRFEAATQGKIDQLQSFIGTSTTPGLARSLAGIMDTLQDENTGALSLSIKGNNDSVETQNKRIDEQQDRIDQLRRDLEARMAAADAAIAMLEQQAEYFNNMFASMKTNQASYNG